MAPLHIAPGLRDDPEWCARLMASNEPWITLKRNLEGCRATLSRAGTELFVARDSGASDPVGFILLAPYGFAGSPYVASIAVAPDGRSHGVGARLLTFAEQRYRDRGHLFLLVSSFNQRAQQFYRCLGFEFIGELKDYLVSGHSELIFHKRLA
jgi:ribosomal protein S18 acetylase RimI-like enzyme